MRRCGRCPISPRVDDPLQRAQWQGEGGATITTSVCRDCEAEIRGGPPPEPHVYPPGDYPAPLSGRLCAICFQFMRENDSGEQMRIYGRDILPGELDGLGPFSREHVTLTLASIEAALAHVDLALAWLARGD